MNGTSSIKKERRRECKNCRTAAREMKAFGKIVAEWPV
jgi:hypothetical protein